MPKVQTGNALSSDKPGTLIPPAAAGRANNLNIIRLVLATAVLASHSVPLASGSVTGEWLLRITGGQLSFGDLAVCGFFALSGFLILQSWCLTPSPGSFLFKRFLRIYPGFLVATVFSVVVIGAAGAGDPFVYLRTLGAGWKWAVWQAITLDRPLTPPTLPENPYSSLVNGSMWTIRYEWWCYVAVAGGGIVGLWKRPKLALPIWISVFAIYILEVQRAGLLFGGRLVGDFALSGRLTGILGALDQWPRFGTYFLAGCVVYAYRDVLPARRAWVALSLLAVGVGAMFGGLHAILPIFGVYLLFYTAFVIEPVRTPLTDGGKDFSYGIYLYAYPVQQLLVSLWLPARAPVVLLFAALVVVGPLAVVSWHFVEHLC